MCGVQVVLVGDSRVGKSSLLAAFAAEKFDATYAPTVGVNFKSRTVRIDDGDGYIGTVKLTVWDSAGASSSPLEHVPASPIDCVAQTLGPTQALTCVSYRSRAPRRRRAELSSNSEHVLQGCTVRRDRLRRYLAQVFRKCRALDV